MVRFTRVLYDGFDWDRGNLAKACKHGLSAASIEKFFERNLLVTFDSRHSSNEQRYIAAGESELGRSMFVAFTYREALGLRLVRVISARYMHKKESRIYEKLKKNAKA